MRATHRARQRVCGGSDRVPQAAEPEVRQLGDGPLAGGAVDQHVAGFLRCGGFCGRLVAVMRCASVTEVAPGFEVRTTVRSKQHHKGLWLILVCGCRDLPWPWP